MCEETKSPPRICHSDRSASGVEESTTLEEEPTQGKTCNLGRFLDSHSLARNDMSGGGAFLSAQVIFETWRAAGSRPYLRGSVQPHGLNSGRSRNGTQAVPYGCADWWIFYPAYFKNGPVCLPIIVNCQLSIVNLEKTVNCQLPQSIPPPAACSALSWPHRR